MTDANPALDTMYRPLGLLESESDGYESQIASTWPDADTVEITKPADGINHGINNTHSAEKQLCVLPQNFECSRQVAPRALDTDLIFEAMFEAC